jgi:hypothetical protein
MPYSLDKGSQLNNHNTKLSTIKCCMNVNYVIGHELASSICFTSSTVFCEYRRHTDVDKWSGIFVIKEAVLIDYLCLLFMEPSLNIGPDISFDNK